MIRQALAGKRIAITGSTGFLGTALVERLLRSVPDCELVLLVRAGPPHRRPRSGCSARSSRTTPSTGSAPSLGSDGFDEMMARRVTVIAGDVEHRRPRPRRRRPRRARRRATSSSTPRRRCRSTRRSTAPSRSTCSARPASSQTLHDLGVTPHLVAVSTCYVAGNRRGDAPEELVQRRPVRRRRRLARRGRRGPPRRAPTPRPRAATPEQLAQFRTRGPRTSSAPPARPRWRPRPSSCAQRWVTDQLVEAGRARAAIARLARRLRLHQGARRAGADRDRRATCRSAIVRPSIIESALAEPPPGLDPRLPHGRAGDHLLRPRAAEGVPRRARGHGRRDPRRPRRRRHHRASPALGPEQAPPIVQVASGSTNPLRYRGLVDLVHGWFTEHPLYDAEGQPIVVPEWSFPGRGRVQGQLKRAKTAARRGPRRCSQSLPLRGKQAEWCAPASRRSATRSSGRSSYVELYGAYAECEAIYGVDHLLDAVGQRSTPRTRTSSASTRASIDWDALRHRGPPAVGRRSTPACGPRRAAARARRATTRLRRQVLVTRAPPRRVRPREHAHRVERGRELLVAGHPPPRPRRAAALRRCGRSAEAPGLLALDRKDRGDFLRYFYRRYEDAPVDQIDEDAAELFSAADPHQVVPRRRSAGSASTARSATARC